MFILPSMSRPQQCAEILKRIKDSGCTSPGFVFVNGWSHYEEYAKLFHDLPDNWEIYANEENIGCIGALNRVFELYPNEPWYGFIGDDEYIMPDNPRDWDKRLIEAAGDWNISHGMEDWHDGKRMQGYVVIGGNLARAVGHLGVKECFHHYGFDSAWEWLSSTGVFQIKLVPEVKIHHARPEVTNAEKDDCYRLADNSFGEDRNRFWDWVTTQMPLAAERIRNAKMEEMPTLEKMYGKEEVEAMSKIAMMMVKSR